MLMAIVGLMILVAVNMLTLVAVGNLSLNLQHTRAAIAYLQDNESFEHKAGREFVNIRTQRLYDHLGIREPQPSEVERAFQAKVRQEFADDARNE
jgi:hypothetical protein